MSLRVYTFVFVTLYLLASLSYSQQTTFNPTSVSYLKTNVVRTGTLSPTTGYIYDISLNLSVPQQTSYQSVSMSLPQHYSLYTEDENQILMINDETQATSYTYRFEAEVETYNRSITRLDNVYSFGSEFVPYTKESAHVKFSREINEVAKNITQHYTKDIDKIAALAIWVNKYITYDLTEVGKNKDSTLVYKDPRGVCVEYTNLFLALSRSLGYPSRAVHGYAYSQKYGWQLHSWAEVYIGNTWVGVDPTWLEVGYIDATHIPVYFGKDTELVEHASAHLTNNDVRLVWMGKGSPGSAMEDIEIIDYEETVLPYEIKIVPEKGLAPGGKGALLVTVNSPDYRMFTMYIVPCIGESKVLIFDQEEVNVFMHPGMNNIIVPFKVSSSLHEDYNYFCPVTVGHNFGTNVVDVNVSGMRKNGGSFSAVLSEFTANGASVRISSLSNKELFIVEDHSMESVTPYNGYTYDFQVKKGDVPVHNLLIYNKEYAEHIRLDFSGLESTSGKYSLDDLYITENIPTDKTGMFVSTFTISGEKPYTVKIYIDGSQEYFEKSDSEKYALNYTIPKLSAGRHKFLFIIDFGFDEYKYESFIEVFEPHIKIDKVRGVNGTYIFAVSGPYKAYELYVDGHKVDAHSQISLSGGPHELRVEWIDKAGYIRVHTETLSSNLYDGTQQCVGAAALIVLSLILFYLKSYPQYGIE